MHYKNYILILEHMELFYDLPINEICLAESVPLWDALAVDM